MHFNLLSDIRLFDKVGTGVAMEGSPPELASVARHVIGSCDGPSIGSFLKAEVLEVMDPAGTASR